MSVNKHTNDRVRIFSVRTITCCAVLAAISVLFARFLSVAPTESSRYSLESVPIFLSGMLFGPVAGALVGFASDLIGCIFSSYGYNPIFSLPPVLYGLCAGLFRPFLLKKIRIWRIAVAFLPSVMLGSVLWQSTVLTLVYGGGAGVGYFTAMLVSRAVQFAIIWIVDVLLVWMLCKSNILSAAKLWTLDTGGH